MWINPSVFRNRHMDASPFFAPDASAARTDHGRRDGAPIGSVAPTSPCASGAFFFNHQWTHHAK